MEKILYKIVSEAKADAKETKSGELRKTKFLVFPDWLNSEGVSVKVEARTYGKIVSGILDMISDPSEIQEFSPKQLANLTGKFPGLAVFLEEQEVQPVEFWEQITTDLAEDSTETDPSFRFFSLVSQEVAIEDMASANLNNIFTEFEKSKLAEIQKMRESYSAWDLQKMTSWMEQKIAKNGVRKETIKSKDSSGNKTESVKSYIRVKAAKK